MLEHVPGWLGNLLRNVRAGHEKLVLAQLGLTDLTTPLELSSPAFTHGERLPERFTADGEGISPPLVWGQLPPETASLALIVEDPDAPAPQPLVHAIVWGIAADDRRLGEGAISAAAHGDPAIGTVGRNSYLAQGWLPPDPPTGHGSHDYVFQLLALGEAPAIDARPGRTAFVEAVTGRVLAAGLLTGTYSRSQALPSAAASGLGSTAAGALA